MSKIRQLLSTILCPECDGSTHVYNSRGADSNKNIRRMRECVECGNRFKTVEKIEWGRK